MANLSLKSSAMIQVLKALAPNMAILITGPTGVGKSALARELADQLGNPLVDVRGSTMDETGVNGIPDFDGSSEAGVSFFLRTSWFKRACDEPCVLLLDEMNRAMPQVLQSFFQLVLDREMGNGPDGIPYRLHPETRVIACINSGSEYDVNEIDPALLRRFWVCEFNHDHEEWCNWAARSGVSQSIIDYIRLNPRELREDPSRVANGTVCPNPASWTRFDQAMRHAGIRIDEFAGKETPPLVYWIGSGFLGCETVTKFTGYLRKLEVQVTGLDVLNRYHEKEIKSKINPRDAAQCTAIIDQIMDYWASPDWSGEQTVQQRDNLRNFVLDTSDEYAGILWTKGATVAEATGIKEKVPQFAIAIHASLADIIVKIALAHEENSKN